MRHIFLYCGIAALLLSGVAQTARADLDTLWTRTYALGGPTVFYAATELQTGGFAAAGYVSVAGTRTALLAKINPLGDTTWVRLWGLGGTSDEAFDVTELSNGTIAICGTTDNGLTTFVAGYSQNGELLWNEAFDPIGGSQGVAITPLPNGGFWVLGRIGQGNGMNFWLMRCDADGDSLFTRAFGTPGTDFPAEILPGQNGNLELIGTARETTNPNNPSFYMVTTDPNGNFIRERVIGGALWEQTYCATRDTTTGDLILGGEIRQTSTERDGLAVRLSAAGEQQWSVSYSNGLPSERITGAAPYLEGGVLLAGQSGTGANSPRLWLMSVGVGGDTLWTWAGTENGRGFEDLIRVSDGGFIACGRAMISSQDRGLMWRISPPSGISGVVRDRDTGELVSGVRIQAAELPQYSLSDSVGRFTLSLPAGNYTLYSGGPCFSGDTLRDILVVANQNTEQDITVGVAHMFLQHSTINVLAPNRLQGHGSLVVSNEGSGDLVYSFEARALSPAGNWLRVVPPSGRIVPGDTLIADVIVEADTTDDGNYDFFGEIRVHTNSCPDTLVIVDVLAVVLDADSPPQLPSEFALYPAYPNPFNGTTTLRFGLDREVNVSMTLYDVTGRQVATLLNDQKLAAGEHSVQLNADGLASGLYFVNLKDQTRSLTQRILYIR